MGNEHSSGNREKVTASREVSRPDATYSLSIDEDQKVLGAKRTQMKIK